jgi:pseudouridine kinase
MAEPAEDRSVSVIGAMTADRVLALKGPLSAGAINPVETRHAAGGPARTVAECLARLAVPVRLLSLVGDDQDGRALVLETARQGVDTSLVQKSLSRPTASMVTIQRPDGSLHSAFADMQVCAAMDRGFIQSRWLPIRRSPLVLADTWLPADSLAWLAAGCREHRVPLVIDAVSTATARHLPPALHGVALLFAGTDEARAILGDELERDATAMAAALRRRGAARVLVAGSEELAGADRNGTFSLDAGRDLLAAPAARAAFLAGMLCGRLQRRTWRASAALGLAAARLVAAGSLDALTPDALADAR